MNSRCFASAQASQLVHNFRRRISKELEAGQIFDVIKKLNQEQGVSVLLVEQNARMALKVAHRGYVLETGRITFTDKAEVLLNDPRIRAAYLGE